MSHKKSEKSQKAYNQMDHLTHAYRRSQVVFTAYESGLFDNLSGSDGKTADQVAADLQLSNKGVTRLLTALCALNIIKKKQELYKVSKGFKPLLNSESDDYLGGMFDHEIHLYKRWSRLLESVKSGQPVKKTNKKRSVQDTKRFINAMETLGRRSSPKVINKLKLKDNQHILDLGGGPGVYMESFFTKRPQMKVTLFDQGETIRYAQKRLATHPFYDRMFFKEGDLLKDGYGKNYDIIFISNVIHIYGPDKIFDILKKCHTALKPKGRVFIKDFFLNKQRTGPEFSSQFSLHMLLSSEDGECYSISEMLALLERSGFKKERLIKLRRNTRIIESKKTAAIKPI